VEHARYAASYPSVMREMGSSAHQTATGLGWEAVIQRFEQVVAEALAGKGKKQAGLTGAQASVA